MSTSSYVGFRKQVFLPWNTRKSSESFHISSNPTTMDAGPKGGGPTPPRPIHPLEEIDPIMKHRIHTSSRRCVGTLLAMSLVALVSASVASAQDPEDFLDQLKPGYFTVCKVAVDSSDEFPFTVTSAGSTILDPNPILTNGECADVFQAVSGAGIPPVDVTIEENVPAGYGVDGIFVWNIEENGAGGFDVTTHEFPAGTTSITGAIDANKIGCVAIYYNSPLCGNGRLDEGEQCDDGNNVDGDGCSAICTYEAGGDGCTPGYWKQPQHFDSYTPPYEPTTLFSDVFEDAFPGQTLRQVMRNGGGGLNALGRHTVAALLNAASADVSYDMTVQGVIDAFNTVYPGTKPQYNALKNVFEGFNEQGCPLN